MRSDRKLYKILNKMNVKWLFVLYILHNILYFNSKPKIYYAPWTNIVHDHFTVHSYSLNDIFIVQPIIKF